MPFFPQAYLPETALFQLLSELDEPQQKHPRYHQQQQQHPACVRRAHRPQSQTITPRFDVTETAEAYELYGELPGLQQQDLDIQFSDAQTLIIKGKTERASTSTTSTSTAGAQQEPAAVAEPEKQATDADETSSQRSLTATVEDDYDEADTPLATPASTSSSSSSSTTSPTAAEKGKAPESSSASAQSTSTPAVQETPQAKYWIAERRFGEFARSFTFEQRIEQDFVTAGLKDGVLHVVVPKSLRSKRVTVSVL